MDESFHPFKNLKNAYGLLEKGERPFTLFSKTWGNEYLDHIYYKNFTPKRLRQPYTKKDLKAGKTMIPNEFHCSDHFPLAAEFSFDNK